jgi:hypothetical protein
VRGITTRERGDQTMVRGITTREQAIHERDEAVRAFGYVSKNHESSSPWKTASTW